MNFRSILEYFQIHIFEYFFPSCDYMVTMTFGTVFVKSFLILSPDASSSNSNNSNGNDSDFPPGGVDPTAPAYNPSLDVVWVVVTYVLLICGVVVVMENLFIITCFALHRQLHLLSNLLLVSLCVADMLYAGFGFYGAMALESAQVSSMLLLSFIHISP